MEIKRIKKGIEIRCRHIVDILFDREWPNDDVVLNLYNHRDIESIKKRLRNKRTLNVAFFCMSVSLWKYDTIFKLMQKDPLFHPIFFISPRKDTYRIRRKEVGEMIAYCRSKNYEYVNLKSNYLYIGQNIKNYNIDLAFYSQPYSNICPRSYYYDKLVDALSCYVPYGYLISKMKHNYVSLLNRIAWKVYMPTTAEKHTASLFCEDTSNMEDVGYLGYDMYLECDEFKWKKQGPKRVIWAPHFSIKKDSWLHLSSFLSIFKEMLELANKYKESVQFVFKPHPHLFPSLCSEWGEVRAKEYYDLWAGMENTMLVEGEVYPVFKSSDALIHDCASFMLDYMFTQKPCLYVSSTGSLNVETAEDGMNAYQAHYHAKNIDEIDDFIQHVVIDGQDFMSEQRYNVLQKHILPRYGKSASENIVEDIKELL